MDDFSLDYKYVLIFGCGILLLFYFMVYLVDIRGMNIFGIKDILNDSWIPILWNHLFKERGPVEIIQWTFLGLFTLFSYKTSKNLKQEEKIQISRFWLLLVIAGLLMLIEDVTNIRHLLFTNILELTWTPLNRMETIYFGIIGAIPLIALVKYGKFIYEKKVTFVLILLGFFFYGSAAFVSGPAGLTNFNVNLADNLYEFTSGMNDGYLEETYENVDEKVEESDRRIMDIRARLIDYLVEESLELLGVTMLLSSVLSYSKHKNTN